MNKKWETSLVDVRTCHGADLGSDHYLLVGKIWIKLKKIAKEKPVCAYALENLKKPATAEGFWLEVANRFKTLQKTRPVGINSRPVGIIQLQREEQHKDSIGTQTGHKQGTVDIWYDLEPHRQEDRDEKQTRSSMHKSQPARRKVCTEIWTRCEKKLQTTQERLD